MIKFGVVGYGFIGRRHVETFLNHPDSTCTAVCDINPIRLDEVKALHPEIELYDHIDKMLAEADIDSVMVSCNNRWHKDIVIKAANAGKHIICEKPAAMSVAEFDEMMEAVERNGVYFTVHQQRRWDKDFRTVKTVLDEGLVGDVYTIQSRLCGYNGNMHDWHVFAAEGGGMLYDWGVHLIDQMLFMIPGKIKSVYADIRNVINAEVDDYFNIMLKFESGIVAQIELGTYLLSDKEKWFERHWYVGGNKGSMYCDKFDPEGTIIHTAHLLENVAEDQDKSTASYGPTRSFGIPEPGLIITEPLPKVDAEQAYYFRNYFRARKGEEDFLVKPAEVRRVLEVMEAVRESGKTGMSLAFEA